MRQTTPDASKQAGLAAKQVSRVRQVLNKAEARVEGAQADLARSVRHPCPARVNVQHVEYHRLHRRGA